MLILASVPGLASLASILGPLARLCQESLFRSIDLQPAVLAAALARRQLGLASCLAGRLGPLYLSVSTAYSLLSELLRPSSLVLLSPVAQWPLLGAFPLTCR